MSLTKKPPKARSVAVAPPAPTIATDPNEKCSLAFDPGLRALGWSVCGSNGVLINAGLSKGLGTGVRDVEAWLAIADEFANTIAAFETKQGILIHRVAYEKMVFREGAMVADILQLAGVTGASARALVSKLKAPDRVEWIGFLPEEWKGQIPKDVYKERLFTRVLSAEERDLLEARLDAVTPEGLRHNVIDGVGINMALHGRHAGGRAPRKQTYRRT